MSLGSAGWEDQGIGEAFFIFGSAFVGAKGRANAGSMTRADSRAIFLCSHIQLNFMTAWCSYVNA